MRTITIYGSSDDLIEFEGDITEEYCVDEEGYLIFDNDVVVKFAYTDDGEWKFQLVSGPAEIVSHIKAGKADCEKYNDYSDVLTIKGDFNHAYAWKNNPPSVYEIKEFLSPEETQSHVWHLSEDKLRRILKIAIE